MHHKNVTTDKKYYLLGKKMLLDLNNFIHNINIYFHLSIAKMPDMVQVRCGGSPKYDTLRVSLFTGGLNLFLFHSIRPKA